MELVDWKMYTALAVGVVLGIVGFLWGATMMFGPVLGIGGFLLVWLVLGVGQYIGQQVRSRAS